MKKIFIFFLLIFIFILALFLRIYFSYGVVFSDPIKYAADDGVYHMRLVENQLLGGHFPKRIYFDPYTYFPYGTYIHFTPLYDYLLATIIWVISLGKPTLEIISKIAPFYPAVLGALIIFPVYFLSRSLWGQKVGLLAAFFSIISGPFLAQSLIGSNDHHVAEVFFSTLGMMFLILALNSRQSQDKFLGFKEEIKQEKRFWILSVLTGISFALYFLAWTGALLFLLIIFLFFSLYYLIGYFSGKNPEWALLAGSLIFLIILLIIVPFFNHPDILRNSMYNLSHLASLLGGLICFILLWFFGTLLKEKKDRKIASYFLSGLIAVFVLVLLMLKLALPILFDSFVKILKGINTGMAYNDLARQLINEMAPLTLQAAIDIFSTFFFISFGALIFLVWRFLKNKNPSYLLIIIWTLVIALMTGIIPLIGQRRFIVYLGINIAILTAYFIVKGFEFGWRSLRIASRTPKESNTQPYFLVGSVFIIFIVLFFLLYPYPFNIMKTFPDNLPLRFSNVIATAKSSLHVKSEDWYQSLKWLKDNTPDTGVDYYALYEEPKVNKETGKIEPYSYPESAYGVVAPWDMGHVITYYAHRIPISNPFAQGFGKIKSGENIEIGEASFFLENDELKAVDYLDQLRARYIIMDSRFKLADGYFKSDILWAQSSLEGYVEDGAEVPSRFDNSMSARLYLFDGRATTTKRLIDNKVINFNIKHLSRFRLVFESENSVDVYCNDDNKLQEVKIFEYVKGAKVSGKAESGSKISISTMILTNQQRQFIYEQSQEAENGNFEFIVPYSTYGKDGYLAGQTKFSVFAQPYKLKINNREYEVKITESDVLEGKTIKIN